MSNTTKAMPNFTNTSNLYGSGLLTNEKAIKAAIDLINDRQIVCFQCYSRPSKDDSTKVQLIRTDYVGLIDIDGKPALRVNSNKDIDGHLSHSIIPSWYEFDSVDIAINLTRYLYRCYPINSTDIIFLPQ